MEFTLTKPEKEFNDFLELEDNYRIIFSGEFGIGKTYFLKKHFESHKKYITLHLYPTNYSISSNQDIFELIKYDILYELLKKNPTLEKLELSFLEKLTFLQKEDMARILMPFIELIPKIGKSISMIFDAIKKLHEAVIDKVKDLKLDEGSLLEKFAKRIEDTPGNIYENDFYTQLIIKLLNRIREENENKQIILIIDDLDRIDPEHIFRLLNIFAGHLDLENLEENKFGLDKILFCCDIKNIRTIYSNKYGVDVDFNGYIDKFYSQEIFHFNNTDVVLEKIENIFTSLKINNENHNYISKTRNSYSNILMILMRSFIRSHTINLRRLIRLNEGSYKIPIYHLTMGSRRFENWQAYIFIVIDFIANLYGTKENLVMAIKKTSFIAYPMEDMGILGEDVKRLIAELLFFADFEGHKFSNGSHVKIFKNYTIQYKFIENTEGFTQRYHCSLVGIVYNPTAKTVDYIDYQDLLLSAIENYYKIK